MVLSSPQRPKLKLPNFIQNTIIIATFFDLLCMEASIFDHDYCVQLCEQ